MKIKGVEQPTLRKAKSKAEIGGHSAAALLQCMGSQRVRRDLAAEQQQQQQQKPEEPPSRACQEGFQLASTCVGLQSHISQEGNY